MTGRPGFLASLRKSEATDPFADGGPDAGPIDGSTVAGDDFLGPGPAFDPIWGTLGPPTSQGNGGWPSPVEQLAEGAAVDVELLADGLHLSGRIHTGRFDRLSGWLNAQSGFIPVQNAMPVHSGETGALRSGRREAVQWVRLDQIVVVADQSAIRQVRPGAPIVQKKRRRVSIVTRAYELRGDIHVHADGDVSQFLKASEPHFLPITDLTVRWLSNPERLARFPFAMVNREQLVSLIEEAGEPASDLTDEEARSA
jgi:hypothetical protein